MPAISASLNQEDGFLSESTPNFHMRDFSTFFNLPTQVRKRQPELPFSNPLQRSCAGTSLGRRSGFLDSPKWSGFLSTLLNAFLFE